MGRAGKVQLKKIESATSRQVSFCKRKKGLFKKAAELPVLCDAQVAVIIFSDTGKVYEYANTSIENTLQRHTEITPQKAQHDETVKDSEIEYWQQEATKLRHKTESLQNVVRNLKGKALTSLSISDIQQLQNTVEKSLARVRSKKEERQIETMVMLQKRERHLQSKGHFLMSAIERNEGNTSRVALGNSVQGIVQNLQKVISEKSISGKNIVISTGL